MKVILPLLLLVGLAAARPEDVYTKKYDHINIDEVLTNDRLYKKYFDCLIGEGKCPPEGKELKGISYMISGDCAFIKHIFFLY